MESSTVKQMHLARLAAFMIGWIVLVRLSFALLRYATDLKHAPLFGYYLEEGLKNAGFAFLTMLVLRSRVAWYWWLLSIPLSSLLASVVYRAIAVSFGRTFYGYLNPLVAPTMGSLFYSMIPGLLLMGVFWAGYAFSRRWK